MIHTSAFAATRARRRWAGLGTCAVLVLAAPVAVGIQHPARAASTTAMTLTAAHPRQQAVPVQVYLGKPGHSFGWGFDIKQGGVAESLYTGGVNHVPIAPTAFARRVFGGGQFDLVRFPMVSLSGDNDQYRHERNAAYAIHLVDPGVLVYASLQNLCSSPGPCNTFESNFGDYDGHGVDPARYATFLTNYLQTREGQGLPAVALSVDNEGAGDDPGNWVKPQNDGRIGGARFAAITDDLRDDLAAANAQQDPDYGETTPMPAMVFDDAREPDVRTVCGLTAAQWADVGVVSMHYGADKRRRKVGPTGHERPVREWLRTLAGCAAQHHKPVWDTEFHFGRNSGRYLSDPWYAATEGVRAVFDETDAGVSALSWWAYLSPQSTHLTATLESALVASLHPAGATHGGHAVPATVGRARTPTAVDAALTVRTFTTPDGVSLWAINDRDTPTTLRTHVHTGTTPGSPTVAYAPRSAQVWTQQTKDDTEVTTSRHRLSGSNIVVPAHSMELVALTGP